jgi:hypothetical protein
MREVAGGFMNIAAIFERWVSLSKEEVQAIYSEVRRGALDGGFGLRGITFHVQGTDLPPTLAIRGGGLDPDEAARRALARRMMRVLAAPLLQKHDREYLIFHLIEAIQKRINIVS